MSLLLRLALVLFLSLPLAAAEGNPYETPAPFAAKTKVDEILLAEWRKQEIVPANLCSDAVFVRRVHLDLTGTLPTMEVAEDFLQDESPDKREALVDSLLASEEFALYFSLKWCDILRVKSEFPINLWPNAVQAFHHWILTALRKNMPYDRFARELLTASGSNFREPAVNFYRGTQNRTPDGFASNAALCFLGTRLETWPEQELEEFTRLFSAIAIKGTSEWKEQIVYLDPAPREAFTVRMPNGDVLKVSETDDPRQVAADWLTDRENVWFAEAAVNRCWFWLFGQGIVEEADDFRLAASGGADPFWKGGLKNTGNPAASRELLTHLAEAFVQSGYDFRALCRMIVTSAAYQQSCIPRAEVLRARKHLAVYPLRRLDAEVLIDIFTDWGELQTSYMSVIPEPFTYVPTDQRTIGLSDGSISSAFLETFGRPARDTGRLDERSRQVTYSQRLYLLNSPDILWRITNSRKMKALAARSRGKPKRLVDGIYLTVLSRPPTEAEWATLQQQFPELQDKRVKTKRARQAFIHMARTLAWTLVNTKEFLFQH